MVYIFLYFIFFLGHGAYFSTLSPYIISHYGENSRYVFFATQLGYPLGYFASGYISDKFKMLRNILLATIIIHAPMQWILYSHMDFTLTLFFAFITRFFFTFNLQLITIAALESKGVGKFGGLRAYGTAGFFLIHFILYICETYFSDFLHVSGESAVVAGRTGSLFILFSVFPAIKVQKTRLFSEHYFFKDVLKILKRKDIIIYFTASFFFYFSYQIVDFYLGAFFNNTGGMRIVYAAWALAVVLEIPFMPLSSRIFHYHKYNILFLISTFTGSLRFLALYLDTSGIAWMPILLTQLFHGIHFTGYYMGSIYRLKSLFPGHLYGTAYGLYMILTASAGGILGNLFFGKLLYGGFHTVNQLSTTENFSLVFLTATGIQLVLFFCFLYMGSPEGHDIKK